MTALKAAVWLLLLLSANSFAAQNVALPWQKVKEAKPSLDIRSFALELRDFATAADADGLLPVFNLKACQQRQKALLKDDLRQPDGKRFPDHELDAVLQALKPSLEQQFRQLFKTGQTWQFVRYRTFKKRQFLLYRIDNTRDVYDFIDFEIVNVDGRWQILDWYNRSTDKWMTLAFVNALSLAHQAQMTPSDDNRALLAYMHNKSDDLIHAFDQLAPQYRENPLVQSALLGFAARKPSPALLTEVYTRLNALADDDHFLIFKISQAYEQGNSALALAALQKLEKQIGDEYQLSLLKAELLYDLGQNRQANALLAKVVRQHPDKKAVFYTALILLGYFEQFEQAVHVLDVLQQKFGLVVSRSDLAELQGLDAFLESSQFAAWQAATL